MSSRNVGLDTPSRAAAVVLYAALLAMQNRAVELGYAAPENCVATAATSGVTLTKVPREALIDAARLILNAEPLVEAVDYISIASRETMEELEFVDSAAGGAVLSLAACVGGVRLIDNIILEANG